MLALVAALSLVPTAALPGLQRDCKLGCAALVVAECDDLATRKARKRCTKTRLNACRRAARRAPKPDRGAAISSFCTPPTTTTTLRVPLTTTTTTPRSSTTTTVRPRPTTTTTTLPLVPNLRGTWVFEGTRVFDTCDLEQFVFISGIRVASQSGSNLAGNLGSGLVPWQGNVLADGWGGVTEVSCGSSCCSQSVFAALGFASVADAAFEFNANCGVLGSCSAQWVGTLVRQ